MSVINLTQKFKHNYNMLMFYFQTERAFQKQAPIFQNKKRILGQQGKKDKKELRYVRNVGLGFKTPKEVMCVITFFLWTICLLTGSHTVYM